MGKPPGSVANGTKINEPVLNAGNPYAHTGWELQYGAKTGTGSASLVSFADVPRMLKIVEIMIHVAHYAGWAAGHRGLEIARSHLGEKGYLALPAGPKGYGALVLHHGWGVDQVIQDFCDRLAKVGMVAYAPAFITAGVRKPASRHLRKAEI